tara:strand:- start:875 stop:1714 length:840 start_codon:yes stop_codon:yes gene_type:complete
MPEIALGLGIPKGRIIGGGTPPPPYANDYSFEFDNPPSPPAPAPDQFFATPHTASMNIINNLTLSAWCKPTLQDPDEDGWVIDKYALSPRRGYGLLHDDIGTGPSGGKWCLQLGDVLNDAWRCRSLTLPVANVWQHVVGTYDSTTRIASIYINGSLDNTLLCADVATPTPNPLSTNSVDLQIGAGTNTPNDLFDGKVDEVSIWNVTMSGAEVAELYNLGTPDNLLDHSQAANGVFWYRMGEVSEWNGTIWTMPNSFNIGSNDMISQNSIVEANRTTDTP